MLNLLRNLGGSMGVSVLQAAATANTQVMHASLAAHVNPSDPMFRWSLDRAFSPETVAGAMALDSALNREAQLIAYLDDFHAMFVLSILAAPLVLLLRVRKGAKIDPAHAVME
jgi:DHA2 family multidrug resistance protein